MNIDYEAYHAPNQFQGFPYDARKADMWSLGMLFYEMLAGHKLYRPEHIISKSRDNGYWALHHGKLEQYIKIEGVDTKFIYSLLCGLLDINQDTRLSALNTIQHDYFKSLFPSNPSILNHTVFAAKHVLPFVSSSPRLQYISS